MANRQFKKKVVDAAHDANLDIALGRAVGVYQGARANALDGCDYEAMRDALRKCKEKSIERIPELFERFKKEAEAVGVKVYHADGPTDANEIVLGIAKSHGVRKIAKSKSMVTEEIGLNHYLISNGLEVTETDLGEWIIQLAGERPSNITIPAIHKTREQVAELFSKETGEQVPSDISTLVAVARKELRRKFLEADMGISGANIAIAETGTLVIVSNEGNARLVTSLPDVHVAVVGYERLVEDMDDATSIIKILSKCGTGQKMTSYVSFITGPSRTSDIERQLTLGCHGPKEVHIVFVDNGRMKLIADPEFREALHCIKCSACLSVCPVYRSIGGHAFGNLYFGGIGAILESFMVGEHESADLNELCSTCGRCKTYCPSGIDVPRMVTALRAKLTAAEGQPILQKAILGGLLGNPHRFSSATKLGRTLQHIVMPKAKDTGDLPSPISAMTGFRTLPLLAEKSFSDSIPEVSHPKTTKRGTVAFFPGCVIENVYPGIGKAVVNILTGLGWEVKVPAGQGCCGVPASLKGDEETARKLATHNMSIADFQAADYILTACPTCSRTLRLDFPKLLSVTGNADAVKGFADRVRDFSEFLAETGMGEEKLGRVGDGSKITFHDSCHARHGLHIVDAPRNLLEDAGYELVEMQDSDACCGFAGSYSITYPDVSESILKRKLRSIEDSGVSVVATDCPGCVLQLRGGLKKAGSKVEVFHTAELLDKG
jgi:iron-sulfur cluster protein